MRIQQLLYPHEEVLIMLRRDQWVLIKMVLFYGLLLVVPIFLIVLLQIYTPLWLSQHYGDELKKIIFVLSASFYYMFIWVFFFRAWIDYYLDIWLVTNERIISIEQQGLFSRTIAEQKLYRIQDVHAEVHGLIATFLDFGNITIQTAGKQSLFVFKEVPKPHAVAKNIAKLAEWDKKMKKISS